MILCFVHVITTARFDSRDLCDYDYEHVSHVIRVGLYWLYSNGHLTVVKDGKIRYFGACCSEVGSC